MPSAPLSGQPLIVAEKTTASADEALAVLAPRTTRTAGELVAMILKSRVEIVNLVVDPFRNRIVAAEGSDNYDLIISPISFESYLRVQPDSNGLISHWSVTGSVGWEDVSEYLHPNNKRTVAQMIDHFVRSGEEVFAIVSQLESTFYLVRPLTSPTAEEISDGIEALLGSGFYVTYELTPKPIYTPLAFE